LPHFKNNESGASLVVVQSRPYWEYDPAPVGGRVLVVGGAPAGKMVLISFRTVLRIARTVLRIARTVLRIVRTVLRIAITQIRATWHRFLNGLRNSSKIIKGVLRNDNS
jgi:hypothetical protein